MRENRYMLVLCVIFILLLLGCNKEAATDNEKELNIGFNPGPYIDQFKEGIEPQLIEKGYKVAICEQVEDPKKAKGVVKREVIQVISPGTLMNEKGLQ